jgi:hypothetical protein
VDSANGNDAPPASITGIQRKSGLALSADGTTFHAPSLSIMHRHQKKRQRLEFTDNILQR